jgi:hypothetical protein
MTQKEIWINHIKDVTIENVISAYNNPTSIIFLFFIFSLSINDTNSF